MIPVRHLLTVGLALLVAAPALAQGIRTGPPATAFRPVFPGVQPGPLPVRPWPYRPAFFPGFGYPMGGPVYYPFGTGAYYGPTTSYYAPTTGFGTGPSLVAPPLQGAGGSTPVVDPELVAELTIEFPADAEITVNGEAAPGSAPARTLTSPPLKAGMAQTFAVKARWTKDGQRYEWERTVTLGPGERSRITVARGFLVSDKE